LLTSPRLLLMNEPLASLDGARKAEVLPFIDRLSAAFAVPILYVSHAIDEILHFADDLVVMENGRVLAAGSIEQVLSDVDLSPITGRQDAGAVLLVTVIDHAPVFGLTRVSLGANRLTVPMVEAAPGTRLRVRIGAQDVALALERPRKTSFQNILEGTVRSVNPDGAGQVDVRVDVGGPLWTKITAAAASEMALKPGDAVFALVKAASIARASIALRPNGHNLKL
jgi:molybdate transport system ATP-binding protein